MNAKLLPLPFEKFEKKSLTSHGACAHNLAFVGKQLSCLSFTTVSLLVICTGTLRAQALAPSSLNLANPGHGSANDVVQIVTAKSPQTIAKSAEMAGPRELPRPITKERARSAGTKRARAGADGEARSLTREPARTLLADPVRPMDQQSVAKTTKSFSFFSFKNQQGKRESVPVISQYYPKQIVYPYAKIDRHIDSRLLRAASIAEERAHAHSRSRCWHYVKEALLAAGVIDSRPKSELARDAAQELVSNYGFKRLPVTDPFAAPVGSVLVYGTPRSVGHVELRTRDGFVSDFRSKTPSRRPLLGVFAKL